MKLRHKALRSLLVSCVIAAGVVVAPVAAYASPLCMTFTDINPGTFHKVHCKRNGIASWNQYRAAVYCQGDIYRYGFWELMPVDSSLYGPWSAAYCPAGNARLYYWFETM